MWCGPPELGGLGKTLDSFRAETPAAIAAVSRAAVARSRDRHRRPGRIAHLAAAVGATTSTGDDPDGGRVSIVVEGDYTGPR